MNPSLRNVLLVVITIPVLGIGTPCSSPEGGPAWRSGAPRSSPDFIVLVRHAERDGPSATDPGLTAVGEERAGVLARLLSEAGLTRIHSTDTRRTSDTAFPLAAALGLEVEIYDGRDLETLALRLLSEPGRHLVVGHSNTTPELAELLGGESHGDIAEAWEYDRLYLLTPGDEGAMQTLLLRFGPPVERP